MSDDSRQGADAVRMEREGGPAPTLGALSAPVPPLAVATPTLQAYEAFSTRPSLYAIAVVDGRGRPVGILNRFKFLESLSRPFGRDLLTHRTVAEAMDASPLVVDEGMPLDHLSSILLDDTTKYIFDGFIVTRDGMYVGIGTGFSLVRALTERRQAALFHLAHHDTLTGLPNRQLFGDRLRQALARRERQGGCVGLLYIDVDRFKLINDNLGHASGDLLLKALADRLRRHARAADTVARLSGDEFALVLGDLREATVAEQVARKLLGELRAPYSLDGHEVNVSCSIGVAASPDDARTDVSLLRAADAALYHAKQFRNTSERYSIDLARSQPVPPLAYGAVHRALEHRHLRVWYQPLVSVPTLTVVGVEALVRWVDPERGEQSTFELIRLAEDAGLITAVTEFVLQTALTQVLEWRRVLALPALTLSVNVSGLELRDGTLVDIVDRALTAHPLPPADLDLEITETAAMLSGPGTAAALTALRRRGVGLTVDDFGTGYSSLARLQRLPVSGVKIDRSFVDGIERQDAGALAQAILLMAHSLGLTVTAEGVETAHQLTFLEANGCDRAQGFLFSAPCEAAGFERFVRRHHEHGLQLPLPGTSSPSQD